LRATPRHDGAMRPNSVPKCTVVLHGMGNARHGGACRKRSLV